MTVREAAEAVCHLPDICNIDDLAHILVEVTNCLTMEAGRLGAGMEWVNQHPMVRVLAEMLAVTTRMRYSNIHDIRDYGEALVMCQGIAADTLKYDKTAKKYVDVR